MATVPSIETVAGALKRDAADIEPAYAAEVSDQASRCRVDPYSDALAAALVRRVQRHIAMKNVPLGVTLDEFGTRIGSTDPEVRRLEAPYRRLVIG